MSHFRRTQQTLLVITALFLSACSSPNQPEVNARLLDVPGLHESVKVDAQAEKIMHAWPEERWWQAFQNPELNRLLDLALHDNPGLKVVTARLAQAQAAADFQAAEMLPTLSSNMELHQRRFSGTDFYGPNGGKTFTGAYLDPAVFRYHLDLWGKDQANLEAALGSERAQASELAMAKLLLSTAVVRSYFKLCAAEEDRELTHALTENAEHLLRLTQLRLQQGLATQDPVYVGEQRVESARQAESSARSQAQKLRNQLASLLGKGPDWGSTIKLQANPIPEGHLPLPEQLALGLLAHRPDIAAAQWRVESAAQLIKAAKANFYPDVNLVGFAGLRSLNLKDLFLSNGASLAYGIGPTLTLPIFEGGRLESTLNNQQAVYNAAVERYNETLLNAVQQVADGLAEWRQTLADDAAQDRALQAAKAAADLADKRYLAGLSPHDEAITAAAARLQQQLTASRTHNSLLLAAVDLIEALGGGYHDNPIKVSKHD